MSTWLILDDVTSLHPNLPSNVEPSEQLNNSHSFQVGGKYLKCQYEQDSSEYCLPHTFVGNVSRMKSAEKSFVEQKILE